MIYVTPGNSVETSSRRVSFSRPRRRRRYLIRPSTFPPQNSTSKHIRFHCPWKVCGESFQRRQDWERHMLSLHFPYWIYCPTCFWRGNRCEAFNSHLKSKKCGPKPPRKHYEIYNTRLVLGWIINDNASADSAVRYALDFAQEKAMELGKTEECCRPALRPRTSSTNCILIPLAAPRQLDA
jgi:hypothetical protein